MARSSNEMPFDVPLLPVPQPMMQHLLPVLQRAFNNHKQRCDHVAKDLDALQTAQKSINDHRDGGNVPKWALPTMLPSVQATTEDMPIGEEGFTRLLSLRFSVEQLGSLAIDPMSTNAQVHSKLRNQYAVVTMHEHLWRMQQQFTTSREAARPENMLNEIVPSFQAIREMHEALYPGDPVDWLAAGRVLEKWVKDCDASCKAAAATRAVEKKSDEFRFQKARERAVAAFEELDLLTAQDAATVGTLIKVLPAAGIPINAKQKAAMAKAIHPKANSELMTCNVRAMIEKRMETLNDDGADANMEDLHTLVDRYGPYLDVRAGKGKLPKGKGRGRARGRGRGASSSTSQKGKGKGKGKGAPKGTGKGKGKGKGKGANKGKGKGKGKGQGKGKTRAASPPDDSWSKNWKSPQGKGKGKTKGKKKGPWGRGK